MKNYNLEKRLNEIDIIRPILIIFLVTYHAFAFYSNAWESPAGYFSIPAYWWFDKFLYSFMLETFVFISGYIFGFQLIHKNKYKYFKDIKILIRNKFDRLIIPSILFSILYYFLFLDSLSGFDFIYTILCGVGHMWFLPMLFWCFILSYLIFKSSINDKTKMFFILCLMFLSVIPIPFRIGTSLSYLFFFYLGILCFKYKTYIESKINLKSILFLWLIYVVVFVLGTILINKLCIKEIANVFFRAIGNELVILVRLLYSLFGTFAFYISSLFYIKRKSIPFIMCALSPFCFGVYLFQQFILKFIYYSTSFYSDLGGYLAPWVATFLSLLFSIIFSYIFKRFKLGKQLIG